MTLQLKKYNLILIIIFICSILLRMGLALYNREANDPHMPVVRYIMKNNSLPVKSDCWECFQPKLFHYTIAKILGYLHLDKGQDVDAQKVIAQVINVFAGIVILLVGWSFINNLTKIRRDVKLLGFALLAFNPPLVGINAQVTNDTFLIMFCVLSVYFAYLFIRIQSGSLFFFVVTFSLLAVLTKTNGWVTVIAIAISFLARAILPNYKISKNLTPAIAYPILVAGLAILNPLSQYVGNYEKYSSPILLNIDRFPLPFLCKKTNIPYAGILSIQDGFFTFKLGDLLENPVTYLSNEVSDNSNRTSLWTRLYGGANSLHYENYPPSWRTLGQFPFLIYRGIYMLALLPLVALLFGMAKNIYTTIKAVLTKNDSLLEEVSYGLFALLAVGHFLFIVFYAVQYRTYNVMKAIFIYPGLLAYLLFCLHTFNAAFSSSRTKAWGRIALFTLTITLLVLYIADISILILQLLPNQSGWSIVADRLSHAWK